MKERLLLIALLALHFACAELAPECVPEIDPHYRRVAERVAREVGQCLPCGEARVLVIEVPCPGGEARACAELVGENDWIVYAGVEARYYDLEHELAHVCLAEWDYSRGVLPDEARHHYWMSDRNLGYPR